MQLKHLKPLSLRLMIEGLVFLGVCAPFFTALSQEAAPSSFATATLIPCQQVVLRALDKMTARASELSLKKGEVSSFRTLRITAHQCLKNAPEDPPQTLAFLEIKELKPDQSLQTVFSGWMFASHPALSALEHPVYDVWVKEGLALDDKTSLEHHPEIQVTAPLLPTEPEESFEDPEASPEPLGEDESQDSIAALYRGLERPLNE